MPTVLTVPIRLDALHLVAPLSVVEAKADFTRMPYWDGKTERAVNPDVANISEDLVSYPFQDQALILPPGVHLHWALPDALARGSSRTTEHGDRMSFPAVPNRWLVTRSLNGKIDQWIVESDYLYPNTYDFQLTHNTLRSVAIPFPCDREKGERPFRYLGRKLPGADEDKSPEYLSTKGYRLTAVGYEADPGLNTGGFAEPTFAALYPNCLSVFGFHDPEITTRPAGLKYDVVGWYSNSKHESLTSLLATLTAADSKTVPTPSDWFKEVVKNAYGWEVGGTFTELPKRTVFHGSIDMAPPLEPLRETVTVTAAMGNTVTEALSAYLAQANVKGLKQGGESLERQLEALNLADRIDHLTIDVGPKFEHARHERGFSEIAGGTVWTVRVPSKNGNETTPAPPLDPAVADLLNKLNIDQARYDEAQDKLASLQKQLYADWYKYMLSAYPPDDARDNYLDIDEVRYFITKNDLKPIEHQKTACATAKTQLAASQLALAAKVKTPYVLQSQPGRRYYRPHEPVLLLAGADNGLRQTDRHAAKKPPECSVVDHAGDLTNTTEINAIRSKLTGGLNPDPAGTWHPFALDWSVEMKPLQKGNNLSSTDRTYKSDFITTNYKLDPDEVDLTLPTAGAEEQAASIYTGSSLMTSHARSQLKERINTFLEKRLLKKYYDSQKIPEDQRTNNYFKKHVADIKTWYVANKTTQGIADTAVNTMLDVALIIDAADFHVLAQSLNGFNEALLMHKQTFQLPLAEPLGFRDAKDFTQLVASAVGQETYVAPQPLDDFQPIRTGGFRVIALRLIDTFGRAKDVHVDKWICADTMPKQAADGFFSLPPRLAQPARLSFRWLSSSSTTDEVEINSTTTPVCGWLLPNHLDNSLMVYDGKGTPQGVITKDGAWQAAPGYNKIEQTKLPPHLKDLVINLTGLKDVKSFFRSLETALENINPASAPQHDALALLIGRPIAVVRAQLKLELRGPAAINQSWDAFRSDVARCLRDEDAGKSEELVRKSDGVAEVKFPIRLGDSRQLNDGLLGYWIETKESGRFTIKSDAPFICGNNSTVNWCVADQELTLTMLVDPRGVVHVTSGILPAAVLDIPTDQYAAAMRALEVTFLTSPIISPANKFELPVPDEADRVWSWVARRKNPKGEIEWAKPAEVGPANTQANWGGSLEIHEGWLRLTESSKP